MAREIGIGTNVKLLDLFNKMKIGDLILRPVFQRRLVWTNKHKEDFIETILLGLPFPEIYLADGDIDLATQKSKTLVVDGQQRLSTIYQYITGSKEFILKRLKPFEKLSATEQTDFFDYIVVARDLGRIEEEKLKDIFRRINSVQYALNAIEINNALYQGEYISCAKEILEESPFKEIEIFSETEYSRMRDIEFILLIMTTVEGNGYFAGVKEIEEFTKRYDENYPNKEVMKADIHNSFELFLSTDLAVDSIWFRKTSFFNLIAELVFFKRRQGLFPDKNNLRRLLIKLENDIIAKKNDKIETSDYAQYYYYSFSGTAGRKARFTRGALLRKNLDALK
ncbi:MAG: DUF262 domain-containing protein [Candidatus Omnitrophota bacterium]